MSDLSEKLICRLSYSHKIPIHGNTGKGTDQISKLSVVVDKLVVVLLTINHYKNTLVFMLKKLRPRRR